MDHNRTALVTGASSGIGHALSEELARHGWNLVLVARRKDKLEQLAELVRKVNPGARVAVIPLDLTSASAARVLHEEVQSRNLRIDCLVNNAGRGDLGRFLEQDWQRNAETIELNVSVLAALCNLFGRDMADRGAGYILNIASVAGFVPGPNLAVYHATKAFVLSLSRALHTELASKGVGVTASCPGPTRSEFFEKAGANEVKALEFVPVMSAEKVAEQAYRAMMDKKPIVVHGLSNRLMVGAPRFLPTAWVAPLIDKVMR